MATFAVLENNTVVNTIVAKSRMDAETVTGFACVEYTSTNPAAIGWIYDAENGTFNSVTE